MLPPFRVSEFERKRHAPHYPPRIADPSRGARQDRELPRRRREGGPGSGGGEQDRRGGDADESVSEESEAVPGSRRAPPQVFRIRHPAQAKPPAPSPLPVGP